MMMGFTTVQFFFFFFFLLGFIGAFHAVHHKELTGKGSRDSALVVEKIGIYQVYDTRCLYNRSSY